MIFFSRKVFKFFSKFICFIPTFSLLLSVPWLEFKWVEIQVKRGFFNEHLHTHWGCWVLLIEAVFRGCCKLKKNANDALFCCLLWENKNKRLSVGGRNMLNKKESQFFYLSRRKQSSELSKGSSINDVTVLDGQWFCDDRTKALVIKHVTMGGGGSKILHNCVLSFMDDP